MGDRRDDADRSRVPSDVPAQPGRPEPSRPCRRPWRQWMAT